MKKFSKITGQIAFWSKLVVLTVTVLFTILQRLVLTKELQNFEDFVFPFMNFLENIIILLIIGLFCKKNADSKAQAIMALYFYLFVTVAFTFLNPIFYNFSMHHGKLENYTASFILSSKINGISYIFAVTSSVCFYLSVATSMFLHDSEKQESENEFLISDKSRTKLVLYSAFLGIFGIDRLYAKKTASGIVKLLIGSYTTILTIISLISALIVSLNIDSVHADSSFFLANDFLNFFDPSESFLPLIFLVLIPYLAIIIFSITDFVICTLGKMKDSEEKLIKKW